MRVRGVLSVAVVCVLSSSRAFSETPRVDAGGKDLGPIEKKPVQVYAVSGGMEILSINPLRGLAVRKKTGDGGGGSVANCNTLQVAFSDPVAGNFVAVFYDEPAPNGAGVQILFDGGLIGVAPGGLGAGGIGISQVPSGLHTFGVVGSDASVSTSTQNVLDVQPFGDAVNLSCREGRTAGATCELFAQWSNPGPAPAGYVVLLNGARLGAIAGTSTSVTVTGAAPGSYTLTLIAILDAGDPDGQYQGAFVETSCELTCVRASVPAVGWKGALMLASVTLAAGMVLLHAGKTAPGAA
jgi:hypothetical protein